MGNIAHLRINEYGTTLDTIICRALTIIVLKFQASLIKKY